MSVASGGEAIVNGLVAQGVDTVFGLPGAQIYGLFDAFFLRKERAANNPWGPGATTLEWTLTSPPPFHQFNTLPRIK